MNTSRRTLLKSTAQGILGALAFTVGGKAVLLTPRRARAEDIPFTVLDNDEAATLSAFGEALAPGAAEAGIAHYVDAQLAADADDALFMIRYLDVPPAGWKGFYKGGLAALDALSHSKFRKGVAALDGGQAVSLVRAVAGENPENWTKDQKAPPAHFFYFVIRGDAVDVVYGTKEGFAALGVPYMAHIEPGTRW